VAAQKSRLTLRPEGPAPLEPRRTWLMDWPSPRPAASACCLGISGANHQPICVSVASDDESKIKIDPHAREREREREGVREGRTVDANSSALSARELSGRQSSTRMLAGARADSARLCSRRPGPLGRSTPCCTHRRQSSSSVWSGSKSNHSSAFGSLFPRAPPVARRARPLAPHYSSRPIFQHTRGGSCAAAKRTL
jgi:hypothetical protein